MVNEASEEHANVLHAIWNMKQDEGCTMKASFAQQNFNDHNTSRRDSFTAKRYERSAQGYQETVNAGQE